MNELSLPQWTGPYSLTSTTPANDPGNATLVLDGWKGAALLCTAASSGTGTVEAQHDPLSNTWTEIECYQFASGTYTYRAPGATITLAANGLLFIPAEEYHAVRFNLGGTSATVYMRHFDGLMNRLLIRLITSGISIDTEFPAAALAADNFANPTTTNVMSMGMVWDGSTWDRQPGNSTDGTLVNLGANNDVTPYGSLRPVTFTLSLDTSAYASGDVLADTQLITNALRATDAAGFICAIQLLDEDDNTAYDIDLLFLTANNSIGTENAAISVTDANARTIANTVSFSAANIKDQINSKAYYAGGSGSSGLMIPVKAVSGSASLAIAAVCRSGTPTHTASGITGILWILDAL